MEQTQPKSNRAPQGPRQLATKTPPFRRLRVYAFDPSLSISLENAVVNEVTVGLPWEGDAITGLSRLSKGPVSEYIEVVDHDPASGCFYLPVDLDDPRILAQDGLEPAEGDPRFHQQMVFAVAMTTITHFERALGRVSFWAPGNASQRRLQGQEGDPAAERASSYVRRLRIYPHAMREANAYYSPDKVALLFGYFPAPYTDTGRYLPGGTVFTCLSHDVVAHETTHALLDGLHPRWDEATNADVLAFHEAFADIVALFQHFSFADVLRHQISRTRGDLSTENLLTQLAIEFGQTTNEDGGALRDAIGKIDAKGNWQPAVRDATALLHTDEPHSRGSILVAAIFDAFLSIYKSRTADLFRLASGGTGVLPNGEPHPDLVNRLALEAAKSAQHVLRICIRALDYCPPVDITFGDYLRGLITADYELVRDDDRGYRIAFIEAFRWRGIYPRNLRSLSVSSLLWNAPDQDDRAFFGKLRLRSLIKRITRELSTPMSREQLYKRSSYWRATLHEALPSLLQDNAEAMGLEFSQDVTRFEVHSIRLAKRSDPSGGVLNDLVIEITQSKPAYFDETTQAVSDATQAAADATKAAADAAQAASSSAATPAQPVQEPDFKFRGGCTLIVDPESGHVRYCITKNIASKTRLARQREFLSGGQSSLRSLYFGAASGQFPMEPFALLHRRGSEDEL